MLLNNQRVYIYTHVDIWFSYFADVFETPTIWSLYKWVFLAFMKISNGDMTEDVGWDLGCSRSLFQAMATIGQAFARLFSGAGTLEHSRYANKPCLSASHRSRKTVWIRCIFAMFAIICPNPGDFPWGGRTPVCRGTGGLSSGGLLRAEFNLVRQERWTETPFWRIQPFLVKNWGWWNWLYHMKYDVVPYLGFILQWSFIWSNVCIRNGV